MEATDIKITGGDHADEDSVATFRNTVTGNINLKDNTGDATAVFDADGSDRAITGTLIFAAGEGGLQIVDNQSGATVEAKKITFNQAVGKGILKLREVQVGGTNVGGHAVFTKGVHANAITVRGGDSAKEHGTIEFHGDTTATLTLHDGTGGAEARARFDAKGAALSVTATVVAGTDGQGTVAIVDSTQGVAPQKITLTGAMGTAAKKLKSVSVGDGVSAGYAEISGSVHANAVKVTGGDHADEDSKVSFSGTGDVSAAIELRDIASGGEASVLFDSTGGTRNVLKAITAFGSGEGELHIFSSQDGGVPAQITLKEEVGSSTKKLRAITIGDSANNHGGSALFEKGAHATAITVIGGDKAAEASVLELRGDVSGTTLTVTDKSGAGGGKASVIFDANGAARSVSTTIAFTTDQKGTLFVRDSKDNAATQAVSFSENVGASGKSAESIAIGGSGHGGVAVFAKDVYAKSVSVSGGDKAAEVSRVTFQGSFVGDSLSLAKGSSSATAVFDANGSDRAVGATISSTANNEGSLHIIDSAGVPKKVSFSKEIGTSGTVLKEVLVGDGSQGGHAVFAKGVHATDIKINGHANGASTARFQDAVTGTISLDDATNGATAIFDANGAARSVSNVISNQDAGKNTIAVVDGKAGVAAKVITFNNALGGSKMLGEVLVGRTVGAVKEGGHAVFTKGVTATNIKITGGDSGENAIAHFQDGVTGAITLRDGAAQATAIFDAKGAARTLSNSFNVHNGEGALEIRDSSATGATAAKVLSFSQAIGSSGKALREISIGDGKSGAAALFEKGVHAAAIKVSGGDALGEDAIARFQGDAGGAITLTDNSATAQVIFDANGGARTVSNVVTSSAANTGVVSVVDATGSVAAKVITFDKALGGTNALKEVSVGSGTEGGAALFKGTVEATDIKITGGDHADEDSVATFRNTVTGNINLKDNTGDATAVFDADGSDRTVTGTLSFAAGEGGLQIVDNQSGATVEAKKITFNQAVGTGTLKLREVQVGGTNVGGHAVFTKGVHANAITVRGGDSAKEHGTIEFHGDTTATLTLHDGTGGAEARARFDAKGAALSVTATVVAGTDGQGTVAIVDSTQGVAPQKITLTGAMGTAAKKLKSVSVGDGVSAGYAEISGSVHANAVKVTGGDHADEDSKVSFSGTGDVSAAIELRDIASGGEASVLFDSTGGTRNVLKAITAFGSGEGELHIFSSQDGGVPAQITLKEEVGSSTKKLRAITIGDSANNHGGSALFEKGAHATAITVIGGDKVAEASVLELRGDVSGTTLTVTDKSGAGGGKASVIFDANGAARSVSTTIAFTTDQKGTLFVRDSKDNAATQAVSFSENVGASGKSAESIAIGGSGHGGVAVFAKDVYAKSVSVSGGDKAAEVSRVTFQGSFVGDSLSLAKGSSSATAVFDAKGSDRAVGATISSTANNEGSLHIIDSAGVPKKVSFSKEIGTSGTVLKEVLVGDGSQGGHAVFAKGVHATDIKINGHANGASTARFQDAVTGTISLDDATNGATAIFDANGAARNVSNVISNQDAGKNTIAVVDGKAGVAAKVITFNNALGGSKMLGEVLVGRTVGAVKEGGHAVFTKGVTATNIKITGGDSGENAIAHFQDGVTGAITLRDGAAQATAIFDAKGAARTLSNSFNVHNGEGALEIRDSSATGATAAKVLSFSQAIGSSGKALREISIGDGKSGAAALFEKGVHAAAIKVSGGDALGEDAIARFQGDAGGAITLTDNSATAQVIFDANGGARTVSNVVTSSAANTGIVSVVDATGSVAAKVITFDKALGGTNALKEVSVGSATEGGAALFKGTVEATDIKITGGDHADEDSVATFRNTVTGNINLKDNTGDATAVFDADGSDRTVTGTLSFAAGEGGLQIVDNQSGATVEAKKITFNQAVGTGTLKLREVQVGGTNVGGHAVFTKGVHANAITVRGGDSAKEHGTIEFHGDTTATLTLHDGTGGAEARARFDAKGAALSVTATVVAGTDGQGTVAIVDSTQGVAPQKITLTGAMGTATKKLKSVSVGDGVSAGYAEISGSVHANAVKVTGGDHADEDSKVSFSGTGDVSAAIELRDIASGGEASVLFDSTGGTRNVLKAITAFGSGEGELHIFSSQDGGVPAQITLKEEVGSSTKKLRAITIGDSANNHGGSALFEKGAHATAITVIGGDKVAEASVLELRGDVSGTTLTVTDKSGAGGGKASVIFDANGAARSVSTTIAFTTDQKGTLFVRDSKDNAATQAVSFSENVGASGKSAESIAIGGSGHGGVAVFAKDVYAKSVSVSGGDKAAEVSRVTFQGSFVGDSLSLAKGSSSATAVFDAKGSDRAVGATISSTTNNEGSLHIIDSAGVPKKVSFSKEIGTSGTALKEVLVGDGSQGGHAVFAKGVHATDIKINGHANGASTARFQDAVTGTISLDDATNGATAIFDANGAARSVSNVISNQDAGKNTIAVVDGKAGVAAKVITFNNALGGSKMLGEVLVGRTVGAVKEGGHAVFTKGVTATNIKITGGDSGENAIAHFQDGVTGAITLRDGAAQATAIFDAKGAARTLSNSFNVHNGEGALEIRDSSATGATAAKVLSFSQAIGSSGKALREISIGDGKSGAAALFEKGVHAAAIKVSGGDALGEDAIARFQGDAGGAITLTDNSATAQVIFDANGGARTVSNVVTSSAANTGVVSVVDATGSVAAKVITFDKALGGTNALKEVSVGSGTEGGAALFKGTVEATDIKITGGDHADEDSVATFRNTLTGKITLKDNAGKAIAAFTGGGTSALSVAGNIDGVGIGEGTLRADAGSFVQFANKVGGNKYLGSVNIASGAKAVFDGTVNTRSMTISGDVTFNQAVTLSGTGGALTINDNAEIRIGSSFVSGNTTVITTNAATTGPTSAGGAKIFLPSNFSATSLTIIDGVTGSGVDIAKYSLLSSTGGSTNYVLSTDAKNQDLIASLGSTTSTLTAPVVAARFGVSLPRANIVLAAVAASAGDPLASQAMQRVFSGTTTAAATSDFEQLAVQLDALTGASQTVVDTGQQLADVTFGRLSALRSGPQFSGGSTTASTGFSSGDGDDDFDKIWIRFFGEKSKQKDRRNSDGDIVRGYDATINGVVGGMDRAYGEHVRLGGSFAYAESQVDGNGEGGSRVDMDSYQVAVYGDYTDEAFYVEGTLGYGINEISSRRSIDLGVIRAATANYRAEQYMALVSGGVPIGISDRSYLTPNASLRYSHVSTDSYTETGGGNLGHIVSIEDRSALLTSLGVKIHSRFDYGGGELIPSAHVGMSYDLLGEKIQATARFTGGGPTFAVNSAEPERFGVEAGARLTYESDENWNVDVKYDVEAKSGFIAHSVTLDLSFNF